MQPSFSLLGMGTVGWLPVAGVVTNVMPCTPKAFANPSGANHEMSVNVERSSDKLLRQFQQVMEKGSVP